MRKKRRKLGNKNNEANRNNKKDEKEVEKTKKKRNRYVSHPMKILLTEKASWRYPQERGKPAKYASYTQTERSNSPRL